MAVDLKIPQVRSPRTRLCGLRFVAGRVMVVSGSLTALEGVSFSQTRHQAY